MTQVLRRVTAMFVSLLSCGAALATADAEPSETREDSRADDEELDTFEELLSSSEEVFHVALGGDAEAAVPLRAELMSHWRRVDPRVADPAVSGDSLAAAANRASRVAALALSARSPGWDPSLVLAECDARSALLASRAGDPDALQRAVESLTGALAQVSPGHREASELLAELSALGASLPLTSKLATARAGELLSVIESLEASAA